MSRVKMLKVGRLLGAAALVTLTAMGLAACGPAPGHFWVNSTADTADARLDGTCATSSGACTLRAALQEANSQSGHNWIDFKLSGPGPHTIAPATQLPRLTDAAGATIDGYTQAGSSVNTDPLVSNAVLRIELRGPGMNSALDGIDLRSPNNVVRGLAVWSGPARITTRCSATSPGPTRPPPSALPRTPPDRWASTWQEAPTTTASASRVPSTAT
jgi:CSLREA domain-containing protein